MALTPQQMKQGYSTIPGEFDAITGKKNPNNLTNEQVAQGFSTIPGNYSPLTGKPVSITADSLNPATPINLGEASAPNTAETMMTSSQTELAAAKAALEADRKRQTDELTKKTADSQKKIDEYNAAIGDTITKDVKPLTDPFRQQLETSERARLKVEENYFANQKLTGELEGLLTEGNILAEKLKSSKVPGLAGFQQNPRMVKNLENISARTGVIQAVMAARNGQIGQAYNLIDRSVNAVIADRQDQLSYYNTLVNFYENEKDAEGNKLLTITEDQKAILAAHTKTLENEVKRVQDNADKLKEAMTNPATALAYANAGITLNDDPATINKKLAEYSYSQEVRDTANTLETKGYQLLTPQQAATKPEADLIRWKDSKGNEQIFYKAPDVESDIRAVNGGLFDVINNKWIVSPTSTGIETAPDDTPLATESQSILAQTGLSILGFNYLTQGTSALTRLNQPSRIAAMKEAENFLNKNGLDFATFQSRFKAYNEVLQRNIQRFNNTQIAEGEIVGTIANLDQAATEAGLDSIRAYNATKNWVKGNFNDADVQKYRVHLNQLQSELAYYNAATQGRNNTEIRDLDEAKRIIQDGIAAGSLEGMKAAIERSVGKMSEVLQGSVNRANKQVWELFGVGDKFKEVETPAEQTTNTGLGGFIDLSGLDWNFGN